MFIRPDYTYDFDVSILNQILSDAANPLNVISDIITDQAKILDIGCGNGLLSLILKKKGKNVRIDGVEVNEHAASIAKQYYDNLYVGHFDKYLSIIKENEYDFIIMADVIEHLLDPLDQLQQLISILGKKVKIILSIPNIAFGSVRLSLLKGNFNYVNSGLLERTHLHFFTYASIKTLVKELQINLNKIYYLQRSIIQTEIDISLLNFNPIVYKTVTSDKFSFVYQFIIVLTKDNCIYQEKYLGYRDKYPYIKYLISRMKKVVKAHLFKK